jgi:putative endonuclease
MGKLRLQDNLRKNKGLGAAGEEAAAVYLVRHGFRIIARNVRYKSGEIDIVAMRRKELHFIEVKSRNDPSLVPPLESITRWKKDRIRRTAEWYLSDPKNGFQDGDLPPCYLSVIGIDYCFDNIKIECIYDAFV